MHFVGNAKQVYRIEKAYTWETGIVVQGMSGTSWCAMALPKPFLEKGITFTLGDHGGRSLMGIKDYELFCVMHFDLVPMIIKNLDKALSFKPFTMVTLWLFVKPSMMRLPAKS